MAVTHKQAERRGNENKHDHITHDSITDLRKNLVIILLVSIKKYFEMTAFPLTNVMRLKHNILPLVISHGNGSW